MRKLFRYRMFSLHCSATFLALAVSFSPATALDRSVVGKNGMIVAGRPLACITRELAWP
jgi:hypothetical protein